MVRIVDTRFLLLHLLADTDELKSRARSKMIELRQEGAIVPTIVLHEMYKLVFQKFGRDTADTGAESRLKHPGLK